MSKMTGIDITQVAALLNIPVEVAATRAVNGQIPFIRWNGDRWISPNAAIMMVESGAWNFGEQTEMANRAIYGMQDVEAKVRDAANAKRAKERAEQDEHARAVALIRIEREAAVQAASDAAMAADGSRRRA